MPPPLAPSHTPIRGLAAWLVRICHRPAIRHFVNKLAPLAHKAWFPAIAAVVAFVATLSMTIPTAPLLTALVMLEPRRWLRIALWAVLGTSIAAALLVHVLGHFGGQFIAIKLPELAASAHWQHLLDWVSSHGWWSLAVAAALPIADTPVLILAAILGMPGLTVFLSMAAGKGLKYGLVSALTAKAVQNFGMDHIAQLMTATSAASSASSSLAGRPR